MLDPEGNAAKAQGREVPFLLVEYSLAEDDRTTKITINVSIEGFLELMTKFHLYDSHKFCSEKYPVR